MIIRTTRATLDAALVAVSSLYDGNITYRDIRPLSVRPRIGQHERIRYRMTITVRDSSGRGASYDPIHGRRIAAACWHVHGHLFDIVTSMDPAAVIRTALATVTADGGNWTDYDRGPRIYPVAASSWCHCRPCPCRLQYRRDIMSGRTPDVDTMTIHGPSTKHEHGGQTT